MNKFPLIKFTLLFITGIVLQSFLITEAKTILILFTVSLTILFCLYVLKTKNVFLITPFIFITIILFGASYYSVFRINKTGYHFDSPKYKSALIEGEITKVELIREGRLSFILKAEQVITETKKYSGSFNVVVSVYDSQKLLNDLYNRLNIGNCVAVKGTLQKPRDTRNPYEFDYEKYLNARGIAALSTSYSTGNIQIISNSISLVRNAIFKIRKNVDEIITSTHNKTTSAMLRGLILADRSGIDSQINQDFINAGVVHVLSVSGLHVGYIVIIFLFLFNRVNLYWRIGLTITGLFVYMIITGSEAPVFRSTIMASVILITPLLGRDSNSINTLSLAAFIILLINPMELFNPSFQLSFSAILSLIIIFPRIKKYIDKKNIKSKIIKYLLLFFGSTLAAQIGTLPFTLVYFNRISITSLAANIFVIPISGLIVGLGIVSIIFVKISFWTASIYSSCNELLTFTMLWVVKLCGNPRFSFVTINQFSLYDSILFYLCLGILFSFFSRFSKKTTKAIFILLVVSVFVVYSRIDNKELLPYNKLSLLMIDVGQGESILIKFPNSETVLIDAGDANERFDNGSKIIAPLLDKLGISKIDYGMISHVDADHYHGFISLIKEGRIKSILKPELDSSEIKDRNFEIFAKANQVPINYYRKFAINFGNARVYVLNSSDQKKLRMSSNDRSGMLKLVYGSFSVLFTGDASKSSEKDYIKGYGSFIQSEILKVAHHGSANSTGEAFIKSIKPKYALISAGFKNKFRHPSKKTLENLEMNNVTVYRTDLMGAVMIQSDGHSYQFINWK